MVDQKFETLVHYICHSCDPYALGATKLNKISWLSDIMAYIELKKPITKEQYVKQKYGPVAKNMVAAIKSLEEKQCILIKREPSLLGQKLYISLKEPDISNFTPEEISLINRVAGGITNEHTAASISEASHNYRPWQLAQIGDDLPHHAYFGSEPGEISEDDIQWAETR